MTPVDLRSDTVTRPTPAMREAMARAEVGDDVYGEDPTVNRLQEEAARLVGKEAALFVPTGTMANQLAIRSQSRHGDIVIAGAAAHILRYESGAAAALSGVQIKTIGEDGTFSADEVAEAIPPRDHHNAPAALVALENTHNAGGGSVWPIELLEAVVAAARQHGLRVHLDGARLFNAVAATGIGQAAAKNAALFAARILALSDPRIADQLDRLRVAERDKTLTKDREVRARFQC